MSKVIASQRWDVFEIQRMYMYTVDMTPATEKKHVSEEKVYMHYACMSVGPKGYGLLQTSAVGSRTHKGNCYGQRVRVLSVF